MLRNRHSNSSVSSDANWSYGYQDHSLNQKNACNSFRYSNCLCLCLPSARPSNPSLLRPSALPSNPPSTPLSSFPTFPPSLPPSISPSILLIFPCSVLPYVGPSFRPSFRVPGDSLRARDPPYLPRSVGPFFYTVGLSLGWLVLLTWGTRKGSTTRLFTAMTWRSPSNAYSDREGSSWNKSTESHKNKFSMHSFPYATIRTSREYN